MTELRSQILATKIGRITGEERLRERIGNIYGGSENDGVLLKSTGPAFSSWEVVCARLNNQNSIRPLEIYNGELFAGTATGGRLFQAF